MILTGTIIGVVALIVGLGSGYLIRQLLGAKSIEGAEAKAEKILADAKTKEQSILLEAKEKAIKVIDEAKEEEKSRREELKKAQERIEQRESKFDQKILELEERQSKLETQSKEVEAAKAKITEIQEQQIQKLEQIAGFSRDKAEEVLLKHSEKIYKESLLTRMRKLEEENALELEKRAKDKLAQVVARVAVSHAAEVTTTSVELPSEDMKGRIIGKEGRNIRAIEHLTGCELVVDDTPNLITISGFSPIRRHVTKRALENLIADGRIQPQRIEEAIDQAKKNISLEIKKSGEDALYEAGIATGLDPKLIQLLGRMRFRTSYGQNVLQHSIEVSLIAAALAEELGADVNVCRIGGLFHDIGKAVDHEIKGSHPEIGYDIMKKFGLGEEIAYLSIAHHEDNPATIEGHICKVADAISGGRPGARKDTLQNYIQRLQELETVASSFEGIDKVFAIRAGREVRVFVNPQTMDDYGAQKLAKDIANKIETELNYPGEIKVTLIRENRITEFAR
jgi:ribonuclease Y